MLGRFANIPMTMSISKIGPAKITSEFGSPTRKRLHGTTARNYGNSGSRKLLTDARLKVTFLKTGRYTTRLGRLGIRRPKLTSSKENGGSATKRRRLKPAGVHLIGDGNSEASSTYAPSLPARPPAFRCSYANPLLCQFVGITTIHITIGAVSSSMRRYLLDISLSLVLKPVLSFCLGLRQLRVEMGGSSHHRIIGKRPKGAISDPSP